LKPAEKFGEFLKVFHKIVVPYLDDKTLASSVDDLSFLSEVDVLVVGHCLNLLCGLLAHADMLAHAHRYGLIHHHQTP
jgi:hypothetical protein